MAFSRSGNLLVSAPTGAGKTNVAVLTILQLVNKHLAVKGAVDRSFKVIYLAPMKALVTEVPESGFPLLSKTGTRATC